MNYSISKNNTAVAGIPIGKLNDLSRRVKTLEDSPSGGTPGGSTTQLQYNNAGSFGGLSNSAYIPGTSLTIGADDVPAGQGNPTNIIAGSGLYAGSVYVTGGEATETLYPGGEAILSGGGNSIATALGATAGTITASGSIDDGATGSSGGAVALSAGSGADSSSSSLSNSGAQILATGGDGTSGGSVYLSGGAYDPFGYSQPGAEIEVAGSTYTATGGVDIHSGSGLAGASANVSTGNITFYTGTPVGAGTKGKIIFSDYGAGSITGTPTYGLAVDSNGDLIEVALGGGTPGGTNGQIQYNNAGAFGGYAIPLSSTLGGTGVAQASASSTLTLSGAFGLTLTQTGTTNITLPTSGTISTLAGTETLTNKRVTPRTGTTTSSATPTINTDNVDYYSITALSTNITSMTTNLSGTPTDGQKIRISFTDNGTSRTITWGASFESSNISLPTATVISTRLDVGLVWNSITSKWRCLAVS